MKRVTPIAVLLLALLLAACGGGSDSSTDGGAQPAGETAAAPAQDAPAEKPGAYAEEADKVCGAMVAQAVRLGDQFRQSPPSGDPLAFTTQTLVGPAIGVLEERSRELRALEEPDSENFNAYVDLYDPIVSLAHSRVAAGNAGDATRAHELELQMVDLNELQRALAKKAGLKSCDVDFFQAFSNG
jgi:hypothetical protein